MLQGITVILGPARCGKTTRLVDDYRRTLAQQRLGSALWLSPTHRSATIISRRIIGKSLVGCFSPNCLTFDQFASRVLDASRLQARPISLLIQRQILRRLIDRAVARGELRYFSPIADKPGFLDLLVGTIQEFKRLEIWPAELAAAYGPRPADKDRELCRLYGQYQQLLTRHDLYDAQGRFWLAREEMRDRWPKSLLPLRHVFVDGFTDFTRTEHEMLEIVAERVDSLSISLPGEPNSIRDELFAKSAQTLAELSRRHPRLMIDEMQRRPLAWPALTHVEHNLFGNPRHVAPAPSVAGIEIVAAGGTTHEIELLAGRIKRLLAQGDPDAGGARVRPDEILVVLRSLDETADQLREVFGQFGVPIALGVNPPLSRAPVLAALRQWLRLSLDDWPFRQLLAVLMHNYFRPSWPEWRQGRAAAAAEQRVHRLQIPSGRSELIAALKAQAQRTPSPEDDARPAAVEQAQLAVPLLERMGEALDGLPETGTLPQWSEAITRLADSLGWFEDSANPSATSARDRVAWQQLLDALDESQGLTTRVEAESPGLSLREFYDHLEEILRCERLDVRHDEAGRVRILSADHARNLAAPYVFVVGLAEKAFPPPNREDCIYSEAETARLVAAGLPLVSQVERGRYEMLLFYEVLTRATRRLILSYPALDSRGQPLSPSPYLSEVERICQPHSLRRATGPDLSSVPTTNDVISPRDFRVRAVSQAVAGDAALLGELLCHPSTIPAATNLFAGLRTTYARRGEAYGPYEGMLTSDAATHALRARYGPERCWSPSQLEQYARCPHQFFLERVLKLEPLDEPALEVDYSGRGQMLHWLMSAVHRGLNNRLGGHHSPGAQGEQEFLAEIRELIASLLARLRSNRPVTDGLLEIDARHVASVLADYHRQHVEYDRRWDRWDSPLRPAHFEVAFGPTRHGRDLAEGAEVVDQDALSTVRPFELTCDEETIRFSGRIDRIDIGKVGGNLVFSIIDYKSGRSSQRTSASSVVQGYSLQLPLYALAARDLLHEQGAMPFRAAYWHVAANGYKEIVKFHVEEDVGLSIHPEWAALETQLRFRVRSLIEGIRTGQFPMHSSDDQCTSHCAYSTVCRVNQARSLEKSWQPPDVRSPGEPSR
jgi:ATP-dependent helicase/DNAse subunit B